MKKRRPRARRGSKFFEAVAKKNRRVVERVALRAARDLGGLAKPVRSVKRPGFVQVEGFVLLRPVIKRKTAFTLSMATDPVLFARVSTTCIAHYARLHKRIILEERDYATEQERLARDGWNVRAATVKITYDDDKPRRRRK